MGLRARLRLRLPPGHVGRLVGRWLDGSGDAASSVVRVVDDWGRLDSRYLIVLKVEQESQSQSLTCAKHGVVRHLCDSCTVMVFQGFGLHQKKRIHKSKCLSNIAALLSKISGHGPHAVI